VDIKIQKITVPFISVFFLESMIEHFIFLSLYLHTKIKYEQQGIPLHAAKQMANRKSFGKACLPFFKRIFHEKCNRDGGSFLFFSGVRVSKTPALFMQNIRVWL